MVSHYECRKPHPEIDKHSTLSSKHFFSRILKFLSPPTPPPFSSPWDSQKTDSWGPGNLALSCSRLLCPSRRQRQVIHTCSVGQDSFIQITAHSESVAVRSWKQAKQAIPLILFIFSYGRFCGKNNQANGRDEEFLKFWGMREEACMGGGRGQGDKRRGSREN